MSEQQSDDELQELAGNITVTDSEESVLTLLADVLESRKNADPKESYVANLYDKGIDAILQKVGEEAVETILAAKSNDREQIIYETADLWFHSLVMLIHQGISPDEILLELKRRFGLSGFKEKDGRKERAE